MSALPGRFFDATRTWRRVVVVLVRQCREGVLEYPAALRDRALLDVCELGERAADQSRELDSGEAGAFALSSEIATGPAASCGCRHARR